MDRSLDLNLLVALDVLLEEGHVSRAAARLGIGQPAMSATLKRLRATLGDPLLVRSGRRLLVTPRARALQTPVREALAKARAAFTPETAFEPASSTRSFRLGASDYGCACVLPALVARLSRAAPAIDLRVHGYEKPEVPGLLERGDLDFAIGVFPDLSARIESEVLYDDRFVGVVRRAHPTLGRGPIRRRAFVEAAYALVTLARDHRGYLDDILAREGLRRRVALTLPSMLLLPELLERGDLVALLPRRMEALARSRRALRVFEPPVELPAWVVSLAWARDRDWDAGHRWFRSEVLRAVRSTRA